MFLRNTQTYDQALEIIAAGNARLVTTPPRYASDSTVPDQPLKNATELEWELRKRFAEVAPKHVQAFVCGPFGNWDGTSRGCFMDGMVFGALRQPFMDALQHFHTQDAARYLWGFVTEWQTFVVVGPGYELRDVYRVVYRNGSERLFSTYDAALAEFRREGSDGYTCGGARRVLPVDYRIA